MGTKVMCLEEKDSTFDREIVGMTVHFINEAYTSRTSRLFANVNDMAELARTKKQSLSTTDCLGGRVKRGLFKEHVQKVEIHADINGAINPINVARGNTDMTWLLHCKAKVCHPVTIKSDDLFHAQNPHKVLVSTVCVSGHKTKPLIAA